MAFCPKCRVHWREPRGEQGEHPCPNCGRSPYERDDYYDYDAEIEEDEEEGGEDDERT